MKTNRITCLLILLTFGITLNSYAGGWPTRPGRILLAPSVNYFFANKNWDTKGNVKSFADNGKFTSISTYLYGEFGINRELTIVGSLPFMSNNFESDTYNQRSTGLGDMELGLKYYFANIDYRYYFSVQGSGIVPLYNNLNMGYKKTGAEIKLAFSGSGTLGSKNFYFNIENGVRQYFGGDDGPVQDRFAGVFGLTLDKALKNQMSLGFSGTYSASNFKTFLENPNTNKDFSFIQATLGYGHSFNSNITVFLSVNQFLAGRNTGIGTSGGASLIYRLDFR